MEHYGSTDARYYDPAYAVLRDPSGDREFYASLARETGGPVLELGCGSGRVLLPIARDGTLCTGLDASEEMLDLLRRKNPPGNLRLVQGRIQDFDLGGGCFKLIFLAFRVFQHFLTVEDQLACLAAVRRHLDPAGLLAFDVFAPRLERVAVSEEPESEDVRFLDDGVEVVRFTSVRRDQARQLMDLTFRFERRRAGLPPKSQTAHARLRYFFRYELEHLLARSGFAHVQFYGGFDRRSYDYVSGETVVIARRD